MAECVACVIERAVGHAGETASGIVAARGGEEAVFDHGGRDLVSGVVGVGQGRWAVRNDVGEQITRIVGVVN